MPNGIVRAFFPNGRIYEGTMTPNCLAEGFGIEFGNYIRIGYWDENYLSGNGIILKGKDLAVDEAGWYENGQLK